MNHPSDPTLFFCHLPVIHLDSLPRSARWIFLITDKHRTKTQNTRDIFWSLDERVVLQHGRDDSLTDGQSSGVWLQREKGDVGWDSEQCEDREVRLDWSKSEGQQIGSGGRRV